MLNLSVVTGIYFVWENILVNKLKLSSAFLIGHEKIDSDHDELVNILNTMIDVCKIHDADICLEVWNKFYDRLRLHFKEEEDIMREFDFEDEVHVKDHQAILTDVQSLCEKYKQQNNWEGCIREIRQNMLAQVLRHDLKFAEYLVTIGYNEV